MEIRNFCIIAHIDHGKSTLADRLLELTGSVKPQKMKEQLLDQMDLEREKGITIKLQPVRMKYKNYIFNLIDTPGHVDFSYEVSRSLAAVEGAILLVDASQGIQAQTLANLYLAVEQGLTILPVVNKIDLPNARLKETVKEIQQVLGKEEEILLISAKTGEGVDKLLEKIIEKFPAPKRNDSSLFRSLIFDSLYDSYKGIIVYVRVKEGACKKGEEIKMLGSKATAIANETGYFFPEMTAQKELKAGDIGYIATGLKDIKMCRVGDTITLKKQENTNPLPGYKPNIPMVYAGIYPINSNEYEDLHDALKKLQLNDAALSFEPESSTALGRGFKIGCLGLLHLEIVKERIRREFNLDAILTTPSVRYKVKEKNDKKWKEVCSASQLPDGSVIESVKEPWVETEIIVPRPHLGNVIKLLKKHRGIYKDTEFLQEERAIIKYHLPLSEVIMNFYDKLKSVSSGYASFNYSSIGYQEGDLVRLDILVAGEKVEALSRIIPRERTYYEGRQTVKALKELLPKQNFAVSLQAAIGGKIIARENISAARKDVLAKLYGGDRTRKDKLLKKQKKGKKKLKDMGRIKIPSEVYLKLMRK